MSDTWASGALYEPYIGRWSSLVAAEFVDWLAVPPGRRWLDVGCGTGALTTAILERGAPSEVVGVDPSQGYVDWADAHVHDRRRVSRWAMPPTCLMSWRTWWCRAWP